MCRQRRFRRTRRTRRKRGGWLRRSLRGRRSLRKLADLPIEDHTEGHDAQPSQQGHADKHPPRRGQPDRGRDSHLNGRLPVQDRSCLRANARTRVQLEKLRLWNTEIRGIRPQKSPHIRGAGEDVEGFLFKRHKERAPNPGDVLDFFERQAERLPGAPQSLADPRRCHSSREFLHRRGHSCELRWNSASGHAPQRGACQTYVTILPKSVHVIKEG